MDATGTAFRGWVQRQELAGYSSGGAGDRLWFANDKTRAEINFYPYEDGHEICELRVTRLSDDENVFFLHFMLDDTARAQELFGQMVEALTEEQNRTTKQILLTCTSALTTSLFAAKMNEVVHTFDLDYEFCALSQDKALATEDHYDAIMLAPQVAHLRRQMMDAHPGSLVFEIPGKVFGSYDAPAAVRLVMHAFREITAPGDSDQRLKAVRDLSDNRRVLIVTYFLLSDHARLGYRLYDRGKPVVEGSARKAVFDIRDIQDLIETLLVREKSVGNLDAIGIAVPGITCRGVVSLETLYEKDYNLGMPLTQHFGVPVYVDNNCNAAAVGCYVSQSEYENLVFFRHAFGHIAGGFGTVIDGTLLKGFKNIAGEPKYFESMFDYTDYGAYTDALWSADGMRRIARYVSLSAISLIGPEAIYLAVDTVDDPEEFTDLLAQTVGSAHVPDIHIVNDYIERVYLGELALALQKLRDPHYRSLGVPSL